MKKLINIRFLSLVVGVVLAITGSAFAPIHTVEYGFDSVYNEGWVNIDELPEGYLGYNCSLSMDDCTYLDESTSSPSGRTGEFSLIPEDPGK